MVAFLVLRRRCLQAARVARGRIGKCLDLQGTDDSQMRKENCPFKYGSIMNACIAYCKLNYR